MTKDKRSFFERLTGSVSADEGEISAQIHDGKTKKEDWLEGTDEGQLTVDVFQTPEEIIIQSTIAGVKPEDLDISITQDMVTIKGTRRKDFETKEDNYYYHELYWGKFARSILISEEIDADEAEATIKNGLLTIRLPKIDKDRTHKIKIKNS
ncbi:MAG: Hsp20/alpha crystallin family protein [Candidatus Niyogibacteria bacterium]|nr:Hsp20/alpha crystallin family protein [Candidatus Niyogibacteria bacterium]